MKTFLVQIPHTTDQRGVVPGAMHAEIKHMRE